MMSSLWPSVAICLSYVLIVTVIGPKLMENRKPMEIKGLMIGYNFSMVAFCGYIMYEVIMWFDHFAAAPFLLVQGEAT